MLVVILAVWFLVSLALLLGLALAARKSSAEAATEEAVYFAKQKRVEMPLMHAEAAHHHVT
jgi:hypothetical protein